ncbi:MAG: hypothetical protein ACFCGT_27965 [Sandaracinaceae bacterium]
MNRPLTTSRAQPFLHATGALVLATLALGCSAGAEVPRDASTGVSPWLCDPDAVIGLDAVFGDRQPSEAPPYTPPEDLRHGPWFVQVTLDGLRRTSAWLPEPSALPVRLLLHVSPTTLDPQRNTLSLIMTLNGTPLTTASGSIDLVVLTPEPGQSSFEFSVEIPPEQLREGLNELNPSVVVRTTSPEWDRFERVLWGPELSVHVVREESSYHDDRPPTPDLTYVPADEYWHESGRIRGESVFLTLRTVGTVWLMGQDELLVYVTGPSRQRELCPRTRARTHIFLATNGLLSEVRPGREVLIADGAVTEGVLAEVPFDTSVVDDPVRPEGQNTLEVYAVTGVGKVAEDAIGYPTFFAGRLARVYLARW